MSIIWLNAEIVSAMHLRQLSEHGGGVGLRDAGLLDSALQRPVNKAQYGDPDLSDLAAAYAYGIARNHPFIDGNKRTGTLAMLALLMENNISVNAAEEELYQFVISITTGKISFEGIVEWLKKNSAAI